jgi:hypothetical protein
LSRYHTRHLDFMNVPMYVPRFRRSRHDGAAVRISGKLGMGGSEVPAAIDAQAARDVRRTAKPT